MFPTDLDFVDCNTSIDHVVQSMCKDIFYSFKKDENCKCMENKSSNKRYRYIPISIPLLEEHGIENLNCAITKKPLHCNHNVYTEMIFFHIIYKNNKNYELNNIPKHMKIQQLDYTLKAFINYIDPPSDLEEAIGHFQAYNIRPDSQIQVYDNKNRYCQKPNDIVTPFLLIYVKE